MLLGALLGRFCEAGVYSPGGCMIGKRPIDWHFGTPCAGRGNTGTGAGRLPACTDNGTSRGRDYFSVSECRRGWKNALFAAVAAVGRTVPAGCAREPEIGQL